MSVILDLWVNLLEVLSHMSYLRVDLLEVLEGMSDQLRERSWKMMASKSSTGREPLQKGRENSPSENI